MIEIGIADREHGIGIQPPADLPLDLVGARQPGRRMHGDVPFGPHDQRIEPGPLLGRIDQRRQHLVGARLVPLDDRAAHRACL